MNLVVIASQNKFESELKELSKLFDCGLETFHLRKPKFSYRRMNKYVSKIPKEYRHKVVIHTHHYLAFRYKLKGIHFTEKQKKKKFKTWLKLKLLKWFNSKLIITTSFHSIADLLRDKRSYQYVFLSPVFDSISKKEYKSAFNEDALKRCLANTKHTVYAMGGVTTENIEKARKMGFSGVAVLGAIWNSSEEPAESFIKLRDNCKFSKSAEAVA